MHSGKIIRTVKRMVKKHLGKYPYQRNMNKAIPGENNAKIKAQAVISICRAGKSNPMSEFVKNVA